MRVVEVTERDGTLSQTIARFALDGETLPQAEFMGAPDLSVLVDIRAALFDYIKLERDKAEKALEAAETQARKDADLVSDVVSLEAKTLAAAEAHAAHVAAMAAKADEAVSTAQKSLKKSEARQTEAKK